MINQETFKSKIIKKFHDQANDIMFIIDEFEKCEYLTDYKHLAYILATIQHETGNKFRPIKEYGQGRGKKYGKAIKGRIYYGRGYVQLTWWDNYKKAGDLLNIDLVSDPDKALEKDTSIKIAFIGMHKGLFTGKKLSDYINDTKEDPLEARRIINGTDKNILIASYYYYWIEAIHDSLNIN